MGGTSGVYAIQLTGTPYVWVGESRNVEQRFKRHRDDWVWPNDATYTIVRQMPGATCSQRRRTEAALARLLKSRGLFMLSYTQSECAQRRKERGVAPTFVGTSSGARQRVASDPEAFKLWQASGTKAFADKYRVYPTVADRDRAKNHRRYHKDVEASRQRMRDYRAQQRTA